MNARALVGKRRGFDDEEDGWEERLFNEGAGFDQDDDDEVEPDEDEDEDELLEEDDEEEEEIEDLDF
jgi:hypothetical protein